MLVTGASGFVGSHLVDALAARGSRVRCLARGTSDLRWLPAEGVDLVRGDITDPASLGPAVEGVATVFHLAGVTASGERDAYMRVNAGGTRNLARAAREAGVGRFLHVSTLAAAGPSLSGAPRTEDELEAPTSHYGRSKLAGERAVRETEGLAWTVVRPPAVYGPRDTDFLKLFRLVRGGRIPRLPGTPQCVSLIHVTDLVRGILAAAGSAGAAGRVYFLSHPDTETWTGIGTLAAEAMGRPVRIVTVPRWVLPAASRLSGAVARVRRRPVPYPLDRVRDLLQPGWTCDGTRAERDLEFRAEIPHREGIAGLAGWYRDRGWLA